MRWVIVSAMLASGCSLIVPGNGGLTPDRVDGGQVGTDAGRDAGTDAGNDARNDAGNDAGTDAGMDAGPSCELGLTPCGAECVDTESDLAHCGSCERACAATDMCRAGECIDPVVEVAASASHTCARRGSGSVWCWGANFQGELGDGTTLSRLVPVQVLDIADAAQLGLTSSGGGVGGVLTWSCARLRSGAVRCWGDNRAGQLGDGTTDIRSTPVDVLGLGPALDISGNCAVSVDRRVYCWGGIDASTGAIRPPTEAAPLGVTGGWATEVAVGFAHRCALREGGEVYCWGSNGVGQLGDGTTESRDVPTLVPGLAPAAEVAAGGLVSCARLTSGSIACWGRADLLGAGLTAEEPRAAPEYVSGVAGATGIDSNSYLLGFRTCTISGADARVSCWGMDAPVPVEIEGIAGAVDVAVGVGHVCAALDSGSIRCWGRNDQGQLGDGTTDDRTEPTPVVGLP